MDRPSEVEPYLKVQKHPSSVGLTCGRLVLEASVPALRNKQKNQGWYILFKNIRTAAQMNSFSPLWQADLLLKAKPPKPWAQCLSFPCPVLSLYHQGRPGPQAVPACQSASAGRESRCQGGVRESVTGSLSLGPRSISAHPGNGSGKQR